MAKEVAEKSVPRYKSAKRKKTLLLLSMVMPGAIWLFLLRYLPMAGIVLAFKNYKIYTKDPTFLNNLFHSEWVGWDNFKFLFTSPETSWKIVRNTIGYNALWIAMGLVIAVAFAVMLNEITRKFVAKTYQTLMFFPYFLSWVVASYFVLAFLEPTNGLLVRWQQAHSAAGSATNWYFDPKPWPYILTISQMWKTLGYSTVLYLATITGIDQTQYEAANIDGATKWQQVRYITIPHLKTMMIILFIMNVGNICRADFGLFYNVTMNSGPLYPTTQVIDTFIYNAMQATNDIGMSSAAGFMQNVVGFICIMTANTIVRHVDEESSLF